MTNWRDKGPDDYSLSYGSSERPQPHRRSNTGPMVFLFMAGILVGGLATYTAIGMLRSDSGMQALLEESALKLDVANRQRQALTDALRGIATDCNAIIARPQGKKTAGDFCTRHKDAYNGALAAPSEEAAKNR